MKKVVIEAIYEGIEGSSQDFLNKVRFEQIFDYLVENSLKYNIQFESKTGTTSLTSYISEQSNIVVTSDDLKTGSLFSKDCLLILYYYIQEHDIDGKNNTIFVSEGIDGCNYTRY